MEARELLKTLQIAERLKDTTRHCTTSKGRQESVAEHSWMLTLMVFFLKDALRAEFANLDLEKVIEMCLIHDLGPEKDIAICLKYRKCRNSCRMSKAIAA